MALELVLSPFLFPIALTEAALCHFHREASHYVPKIIPLDGSQTIVYSIVPVRKANSNNKANVSSRRGYYTKYLPEQTVFEVVDVEKGIAMYEFRAISRYTNASLDMFKVNCSIVTLENTTEDSSDINPSNYNSSKQSIPTTAITGLYECGEAVANPELFTEKKDRFKGFASDKVNPPSTAKPLATLHAGIWSLINVNRPLLTSFPQFFVGENKIQHQSDYLDNYRMFQLSDGLMYQWTKRGKFLERVYNLGQKDSEVRERCGHVNVHNVQICGSSQFGPSLGGGFTLEIDENKICPEIAILTAMISYLDQWSTAIGVGGIYYSVKTTGAGEVPWRRISRN